MPTVRIWTLEPDHDAKAIQRLATKLVIELKLGNLSIQTADQKAFLEYDRGNDSLSDTLTMVTQHCLQKDDCVIFVVDPGPLVLTHQQKQEPGSLIHYIEQIIDDNRFAGKVFLAQGVQELKAWLPVACKSLGVDLTAWQEAWDNAVAPFHRGLLPTRQRRK